MNNISVKYGVIGGLIVTTFVLIQYFTGTLASMWMGFIPLVVTIVIIVMAAKQTKKAQNGLISLKDAFIAAFITGVIVSVFSLVVQLLLFKVIDPDLPQAMEAQMIENTVEMLEKFGTPENVIDETVGEIQGTIKDAYTIKGMTMSYVKGLFFQAFLALIIALIIKTPAHLLAQKENEILDI